jgi:HK97 family phage major capsid protein
MTATATAPGPAVENPNPEDIRRQSQAAERARIAEIDAMCAKHNIPADLRGKWIGDDVSIEAARGLVLDHILTRGGKPAPAANMGDGFSPDLSAREAASYSFMKAIRAAVDQNWKDAGLELEVSNYISKQVGRAPGEKGAGSVGMGFFAPTNIPWVAARHNRPMILEGMASDIGGRAFDYAVGTAGSGTTGGTLVATNLLAGAFIELLRNKSRVMQLGATVLSGLVGNVDIPRQTGASTASWLAETDDTSQSAATFGKVSLAPKHLGVRGLITRSMLMQSTPDIEMLVRADLVAVMALAIDAAALYGSGSSNQPRGIANQSGVGSVVGGTNGAAITIDHLIDMETAALSANAPEDGLAYMANVKTTGALKKLKSTTGQYLWTNYPGGQRSGTPGEINGYPVARTNQLRSNLTKGSASSVCSELVFGSWPELLVAEWGVLEILPNPYDPVAYNSGGILLRAIQSIDVAVRHAVSFSYMSDALTS